MSMIELVAQAIDGVQLFSRFNDWTNERVEGFPIEICRHGGQGEPEIVILKRFPLEKGEEAALYEMVSEYRARAAIEAMWEPTRTMWNHAKPYMDSWSSNAAWWHAMIDAALKD